MTRRAGFAAAMAALLATSAQALPGDAVPLSVSPERLLAPTSSLLLELPAGRRIEFATETRLTGPREQGVRGLSAHGDRLLAYRYGTHLYADVWASGGRYRLVQDAAGPHWTADYSRNWVESGDPRRTAVTPARKATRATPDASGLYTVDLLVLYTPGFVEEWGSLDKALASAHHLVFIANETLAGSRIPARYNLVGMLPAPPSNSYPQASLIAGVPGVMELRNAYGADIVAVMQGGTCQGQATSFNDHYPTPDGGEPTNVDPERDGFVADIYTPVCEDSITGLAHELGHVLGGGHEPVFGGMQDVPNPVIGYGYWKRYAHGTRCGDAGANGALKYDSIMAYGLPYGTDPDGDFFSSPDYSLDGEPCGSTGTRGLEIDAADNVRSMTLAVPYVAAYREPVAAPRSAPSSSPSRATGELGPELALLLLIPFVRRRSRWASPAR